MPLFLNQLSSGRRMKLFYKEGHLFFSLLLLSFIQKNVLPTLSTNNDTPANVIPESCKFLFPEL